jgi:hypothetical protein
MMSNDMMIRIPRDLKKRYLDLDKSSSWKGFPSFVREAIRFYLEHHEEIERLSK